MGALQELREKIPKQDAGTQVDAVAINGGVSRQAAFKEVAKNKDIERDLKRRDDEYERGTKRRAAVAQAEIPGDAAVDVTPVAME